MQTILVMGLPTSGKTELSKRLQVKLSACWFNADEVRDQANDWDFSEAGRLRQAKRMRELSSHCQAEFCIIDMVCPTAAAREIINPDWLVFMDTVLEGPFDDTNKVFEAPSLYDFRIVEKNAEYWSSYIAGKIAKNIRRPVFNWRLPTVQMLGRYQPWHLGHRELFKKALTKTGQVAIMVRDAFSVDGKNPYEFEIVKDFIHRDLDPKYQGTFIVQKVPNIVNITYGRDVGYTIEKEHLPPEIEKVSATEIRRKVNL